MLTTFILYLQAWRVIDAEPMMQPSTQTESWHNSMEEPVKRRKPFRKRKRRPLADEDLAPVERQVYPEQPPQYREQQYMETTEMPRRRRKKLDSRRNQWTEDYVESERPFRKRSHRKKRPTLNGRRISEFEDTPQESLDTQIGDELFEQSLNKDGPKPKELFHGEFHDGNLQIKTEDPDRPYEVFDDHDVHLNEDKSLSVFSLEVPNNKEHFDEEKDPHLEQSPENKLHDKAQHIELPEKPILISPETMNDNEPTKLEDKIKELSDPTEVEETKSVFKNQIPAAKSRVSIYIFLNLNI